MQSEKQSKLVKPLAGKDLTLIIIAAQAFEIKVSLSQSS